MNASFPHKDLEVYTSRLNATMEDKLFFASRVPPEVSLWADFGCASGQMLHEVQAKRWRQFRDEAFIGFDINKQMVDKASRSSTYPPFYFTSQFDMFAARVGGEHARGRKSCLILSSVIHEVLSVEGMTFSNFWEHWVRPMQCDYVAIRDMAVEARCYAMKPRHEDFKRFLANEQSAHVMTYGVKEPGHCANQAEFIEALLKYRYVDTAEREYAETYLPMSAEAYLNHTTVGSGYSLMHYEHSGVPWLRRDWLHTFGIEMTDPTHIKLLLKRN